MSTQNRSRKQAAPKFRFVSLLQAARVLSRKLPPQLAVTVGELREAVRATAPRDNATLADEIFRRLDS